MFEGTLSFPCDVNKDFVPLMQITLPQFGKATGRPGSEQTYEAKNTQMLELSSNDCADTRPVGACNPCFAIGKLLCSLL